MNRKAFTLEVLEELEQQPEQSQAEFMDDLKTLEGAQTSMHQKHTDHPEKHLAVHRARPFAALRVRVTNLVVKFHTGWFYHTC